MINWEEGTVKWMLFTKKSLLKPLLFFFAILNSPLNTSASLVSGTDAYESKQSEEVGISVAKKYEVIPFFSGGGDIENCFDASFERIKKASGPFSTNTSKKGSV